MKSKVCVLGAGHWGMALASVLANNQIVSVWARDNEEINRINTLHKSKYYPESHTFSNLIKADSNLDDCLQESEYIIISTPVKAIDSLVPYIQRHKRKYVITCKGLYQGNVLSEYIARYADPENIAVLSGPSFSDEIVSEKATAVVVASENDHLAKEIQEIFHTSYFRPYTSGDIKGVQLCGSLKNVYAIAAGMTDKLCASSNMKSALLTRALAELRKVVLINGGQIETLLGLAGLGDLMLTCHSIKSRNYAFGYNYSGNINTNITTEGIFTANEICALAKRSNVEMPIAEAVYDILYNGYSFFEKVETLMGRSLKDETTY